MATTRAIYELQKRNQATMRQVNALVSQESSRVLSVAEGLGQQDMGGFLRSTVPGLIDRYGNVNAAAAMQYYDEQRMLKLARVSPTATRTAFSNAKRRADRLAGAKLKAQIYVAKLPKFDPLAKADTIVNYGMALLQGNGFEAMSNEVTNALTRAVGSYNRDTLMYNSALDDAVIGVQRVAEPNACDFCQTVAFDSYGGARVTEYAVEWHNNCQCSIETLYSGDKPFRPDYYEDFPYGDGSAEPAIAPDWAEARQAYTGDYVSN